MTAKEAAKIVAAKNARRAATRAARHARVREQERLDAPTPEVEAPPVAPTALGVKQQSFAASKAPTAVKETRAQLLQAFEDMGGVSGLVRWGKKNSTEFYRIWARLLPKDAPAPADNLPLETLLAKLAERPERTIEEAARAIGEEALHAARDEVNVEDAVAAYSGTTH